MRLNCLLPMLALSPLVQGAPSVENSQLSPRGLEQLERSIEARGWIDDLWKAIKDTASCAGCQGVVGLLKGLAALGDDAFVDVAQALCKIAKVQDDDVCDGIIALEAPIVAAAIRKMKIGSDTANLFCNTFLGLCEFPAVPAWNVPFPSPKPKTSRPTPSGKPPIKVVHYSDIHIDPLYLPGASTQCNKPICCRPYTKDDAPGFSKTPAGPNGDHKCDTPVSLELSLYKAIQKIVPDAAFTLFTGDIVDHGLWNTTQAYNEKEISDAYGHMNDHLKLVYGTVGNHEAHPANSFQPKSIGNSEQWVYDALAAQWTRWTGVQQEQNIKSLGAYSTKYPNGNLRIISLNTNLYYRYNFWMYQPTMEQDPNGQIQWLVKELAAAEKAGERVYIMAHMPLGEPDAFRPASNYLDQIVNRYSSTIAAMFFGHTHLDHFEVSYADYQNRGFTNALMASYIAPSLTPTSGMPSFRVYEVDPDTFGVLDSITYIADMENPAFQKTGPVWTKYYSAKEAYGSKLNPPVTDPKAELTPAFWHNVTALLETDPAAFNGYIARKSRGWMPESCTGDCVKNEICQLRAGRSQDNCFKPKPGIHLGKRAEPGHGHHDDCGVSVIAQTFGTVAVKKEMLEELHARYAALGGPQLAAPKL